jgi:hypothetical protein
MRNKNERFTLIFVRKKFHEKKMHNECIELLKENIWIVLMRIFKNNHF